MVRNILVPAAVVVAAIVVVRQMAQELRAGDNGVTAIHVAAPEFVAGSRWLNTKDDKPLTLADLKGKVAVVHFWTNGCINCVHNYPAYKKWQDAYAGKDVRIVGIHTPEFDGEKDVQRIERKMKENGLTFAVVVDNDTKHWKAWGNHYWPAIYLVDKRGTARYKWEGEVGVAGEAAMRAKIDELLAEK